MHPAVRPATVSVFAFAVLILTQGGEARAQQLSMSCTNASSLLWNGTGTYQVTLTGAPTTQIASAQFRWQQTGPACTSNWSGWVTGSSGASLATMSYVESFIGTFTVQAQVTLNTYNYSTVPPTVTQSTQTVSCQVTVPPPNGIILPVNTNGTPLTFTTQVQGGATMYPVSFGVTCQGKGVNIMGATVKENLTKQLFFGKPQPDSLLAGEQKNLYAAGNNIIDNKAFIVGSGPNVQADWNSRANGTTVKTGTQQLILQVNDACGNTNNYTLAPSFSVSFVKVSANTVQWTIGP